MNVTLEKELLQLLIWYYTAALCIRLWTIRYICYFWIEFYYLKRCDQSIILILLALVTVQNRMKLGAGQDDKSDQKKNSIHIRHLLQIVSRIKILDLVKGKI
jgi:hypothetical protein